MSKFVDDQNVIFKTMNYLFLNRNLNFEEIVEKMMW